MGGLQEAEENRVQGIYSGQAAPRISYAGDESGENARESAESLANILNGCPIKAVCSASLLSAFQIETGVQAIS